MPDAKNILLCCDLDRTVLPNGHAPEHRLARPLFARLAARPEITLAYVSGRGKSLLLDAIREYRVPMPDYAIGQVGTVLYHIEAGQWREDRAWSDQVGEDWQGRSAQSLHALLQDLEGLRLQEPETQTRHKLSYYLPVDAPLETLLGEIRSRLAAQAIEANLTWSVDEVNEMGLLDVLPARASKRHAIEFLMQHAGFTLDNTLFAGDSGNDLAVLSSEIPSVLVRNAQESVRREALALARQQGSEAALYLAKGDFLGLDGNYTAGVLEGLAHFQPRIRDWLAAELAQLA